jgi:UDP-N-acetylglucosamine 2-epimerase (non-hydrolysing)
MKKIIVVFGTRPEAIKMCPLVLELRQKKEFKTIVCVTGQHDEMLASVLSVFGIKPDYDLRIMKPGQTLFDITSLILTKLKSIFIEEKPWLVLVHGDTTTTFAAGLAAFYLGIRVGHVEAGLRSWNIVEPFPEEFNRRSVSLFSTFDFCPTELSKKNLLAEHKSESGIIVTGNTGIDALKYTVTPGYRSEVTDWIGNSPFILLTAHRRENLPFLEKMLTAIKEVVDSQANLKIVYPAHPNPFVTNTAHKVFDGDKNALVIPPMDVLSFHNLMSKAFLIMTDSGGVQEEAPYFGIPVLVLRNVTERPEGVSAGTLKLIGNDPSDIKSELLTILNDHDEYDRMHKATNPYGDGKACQRIVNFLISHAEDEK